jgi:hypothetical protein
MEKWKFLTVSRLELRLHGRPAGGVVRETNLYFGMLNNFSLWDLIKERNDNKERSFSLGSIESLQAFLARNLLIKT